MVVPRSRKANKKGNEAALKRAKLSQLTKEVQDESVEVKEKTSDESGEGNTMDVKTNLKRKQVEETKVDTKNLKADNTSYLITVVFSGLPKDADPSSFKEWLEENNITAAAGRFNNNKRCVFVDVEKDEYEKVLKLNQTQFGGNKISVGVDNRTKNKKSSDAVTVLFSNLPRAFDVKEFLDEHNIEPMDCRFNHQKRSVFVDVKKDELKKTLELDQTKFFGTKISIRMESRAKIVSPRALGGRFTLTKYNTRK